MEPIEKLTSLLNKLPGVGKRSAERMALAMARDGGGLVHDLIAALQEVESKVRACSLCGSITSVNEDPCSLCTSPRRDDKVLCVVESPDDIRLIERSGAFRGRYHALMGKISPMRGEDVPKEKLDSLLKRIEKGGVEEIILAMGSDVESDATIAYLQHVLSARKVRITRLAFGIPAGSDISYSDPVTLSRAIQGRQAL